MQDEGQDGDLSPPWSEVVVVPKNLTTFVLKDLPPGQTILPILSTDTMLHPSFSPAARLPKCSPARNPLSDFRGNS